MATSIGQIALDLVVNQNQFQQQMNGITKLAKKAGVALAATGYFVSIPVFSDVALIMLSPIIKAVSKKTGRVVCVFAVLTASALLCTNAYVAPTPAPLAVAATLNLDIGKSIIYGLIVAAISIVVVYFYCMLFLDKKPADWFTEIEAADDKATEVKEVDEKDMPSFIQAMAPILIPVILIVASSVCGMILPEDSQVRMIAKFLGDKNIALVIGIIVAIFLLKKFLPAGETFSAINDALKTAGPVIFITAAGGALASIVEVTGAGQIFADILTASPLPVILIPFLITALSKFAQGSASVASLLAASLTMPLITAGLISPIAAFISISAGSHVNNSFFWVFAEFFGYDAKTTLKTLCVAQNFVLSGVGLICAVVINFIG